MRHCSRANPYHVVLPVWLLLVFTVSGCSWSWPLCGVGDPDRLTQQQARDIMRKEVEEDLRGCPGVLNIACAAYFDVQASTDGDNLIIRWPAEALRYAATESVPISEQEVIPLHRLRYEGGGGHWAFWSEFEVYFSAEVPPDGRARTFMKRLRGYYAVPYSAPQKRLWDFVDALLNLHKRPTPDTEPQVE